MINYSRFLIFCHIFPFFDFHYIRKDFRKSYCLRKMINEEHLWLLSSFLGFIITEVSENQWYFWEYFCIITSKKEPKQFSCQKSFMIRLWKEAIQWSKCRRWFQMNTRHNFDYMFDFRLLSLKSTISLSREQCTPLCRISHNSNSLFEP